MRTPGVKMRSTSTRTTSSRDEEAFDDVVTEGGDIVVIQCKSAYLPIDSRYSGKCQRFLDGLNKQFGSGASAAAEQLFRNIEFTFGLEGHIVAYGTCWHTKSEKCIR